jgi:hypothetical protein
MLAQIETIFRQATAQIVDHVANFLPGLLVALMLILAVFLIALFVRAVLTRVFQGIQFDRRIEQWGAAGAIGWPESRSPSQDLARIVYWIILILGLLVSLTALNATMPALFALSVFEYIPHVLAALMILMIGAVTARFLARSVLIGAVNMQIPSARLLSLAVKWLVILVSVAMALDHLRIGRSVLLLAFAILFGGIVFAASLALGLGARDVVARALERQMTETPNRDDPVNHV